MPLAVLLAATVVGSGQLGEASPAAAGGSAPPSEPRLLTIDECAVFCDARYSIIESANPVLRAVATDPETATLTYTFVLENWENDQQLASHQVVAAQGEVVSWEVPAGVVVERIMYRWLMTVDDGSHTASADRYFDFREPDGFLDRAGRYASTSAFYVLYAMPFACLGVSVVGLFLLWWRWRVGLTLLVGGLAVGTVGWFAFLAAVASAIGS